MANDADIAIRAKGLSKRFGEFVVVEDLDLTVRRGEIYGFLGPNGSGKTTTMRMLVGLLEPDHGSGQCLGLDIRTERDALRRRIGYMTQHFSLYGDLTVIENLEFVARIYNLPDPDKTARDAIRELGLEGRGDQLVSTLSGGWKQRLALAAAILPKPELLLLDEPTAGVDPKARRDFWDHIYELAAGGLTVLVSTHYMDEAERCHRIAYLAYGKLLAAGAGDEVIARSGLSVWEVSGEPAELSKLAADVRGAAGVSMATPFGTRLRIGGPDKGALDRATQPFRNDERFSWETSPPTLEDVFIHLLKDADDNRRVAS